MILQLNFTNSLINQVFYHLNFVRAGGFHRVSAEHFLNSLVKGLDGPVRILVGV